MGTAILTPEKVRPSAESRHGAVARRPHFPVGICAAFRRRVTGIASDKTASRRIAEWFDFAIAVVNAHRDAGDLATLNRKLALFDAARAEALLTADDHDAALRAATRAGAAEVVAISDFQANPSPENRRRLIAALRHDITTTSDLLATTVDGGQ